MRAQKYLLISVACLTGLSACNGAPETASNERPEEPLLAPLAPADSTDISADFIGRDGAMNGHVSFRNSPTSGIIMRVDLKGLGQGWHGIHLHQVGDCSDYAEGFKASGGHIDPDENEHGLLNVSGPERADLPNIYAGADGRATAEIFNGAVSLASNGDGTAALMDEDGFAVIVHAEQDDHVTQPIGGAGERVACAAITG